MRSPSDVVRIASTTGVSSPIIGILRPIGSSAPAKPDPKIASAETMSDLLPVRRSAGKKKSLTRRLVEGKNGGTLCLHSQALHSTEFYYFKPVIRTRFAKHAMDMVPHGLLGELKLEGYFLISHTKRDQPHKFLLPATQT